MQRSSNPPFGLVCEALSPDGARFHSLPWLRVQGDQPKVGHVKSPLGNAGSEQLGAMHNVLLVNAAHCQILPLWHAVKALSLWHAVKGPVVVTCCQGPVPVAGCQRPVTVALCNFAFQLIERHLQDAEFMEQKKSERAGRGADAWQPRARQQELDEADRFQVRRHLQMLYTRVCFGKHKACICIVYEVQYLYNQPQSQRTMKTCEMYKDR